MKSDGYLYVVRLTPTAITAAKTLLQIKTGAAPIEIVRAKVYQLTKTTSELLEIEMNQIVGSPTGGTVTSFTPLPTGAGDPAALAVGGTAATGVNATAEPTGGTKNTLGGGTFNVLNGEWQDIALPEDRITVPQGGKLFTLKLVTAPIASMTIGAIVSFIEYQ